MGFQLPTSTGKRRILSINSIFLLVLQDEDESPPNDNNNLPTSENVRISPVEPAPHETVRF